MAERVAVITGAAGGIGRAIVERFLKAGLAIVAADLDVTAIRDERPAVVTRVDVGDSASVDELMQLVDARFGRLDVLVNCAGIFAGRSVADTPDDEWNSVIRVNLTGTFYCCRAAARRMKAQRSGAIVNISSLTSALASENRGAYAASKAGVDGLTRALAAELGAHGVRTNSILPGPIENALGDANLARELIDAHLARTPMRRRGKPSEVAAAALYLASPESEFVNGHALVIDGGYLHSGLLLDQDGRPR